MLVDLAPASVVQGDLCSEPDSPRRKDLMRTLDQLNCDFGGGAVRFAATGFEQSWMLRCEQRSPRSTTYWREMLSVGG